MTTILMGIFAYRDFKKGELDTVEFFGIVSACILMDCGTVFLTLLLQGL